MDPQNGTSNNSFARFPLQPNGHDAHRAPIPPPPYTLQAPIQQQPSIVNDPFIPRRQEQGDARLNMDRTFKHGSLGIANYTSALPRDALGTATENYNRMQDNARGWRLGDGRADRFRLQTVGGECGRFMIMSGCFCLRLDDLRYFAWLIKRRT